MTSLRLVTQQVFQHLWGQACTFSLGRRVHQGVLQAVGLELAHGFVVVRRDHDADHQITADDAHGLTVRQIDEMAELGFGFVGGESLHDLNIAPKDRIVRFSTLCQQGLAGVWGILY